MKYILAFILFNIALSLHAQDLLNVTFYDASTNSRKTWEELISGKVTVIIFADSECPYNLRYNERIGKLADEFSGVKFFYVIADKFKKKSEAELISYWKDQQHSISYIYDEELKLTSVLDARKSTEVFVINWKPSLEILYHGAIDDNPLKEADVRIKYLENALHEISEQKKVSIKETMITGCRINR